MNFSEESNKLINFFIDDFKKFHKTYNKTEQQELDNIYKKLYEEVVEAEKYISKSHNNMTRNLTEVVLKEQIPYTSLLESKFIPLNIRKHIKKEGKHYLNYKYTMNQRRIEIVFVFYSNDELLYLDDYDRYIKYMLIWLKIATKYSVIKCSKNLKIIIYLTSFKKELPNNILSVLSAENSNTGITTSCAIYNEICIFRKEEFFKVFIHETFHAYGLDFSLLNQIPINRKIRNIFPLNIDFNVYEAYTEFWATIFNNVFCSYMSLENKSQEELKLLKGLEKKERFDKFILYLDFCNKMERMFSLFQMNKILDFLGIKYNNLHESDITSIYMRKHLYKEKTNVFSYYIIKTILLYNYDSFLMWCDENNLILFKFNKYQGAVKHFIEFIKDKYKKKYFLLDLNKMIILNNKYNTNDILNLKNTMRMTICEIV